MTGYFTNLPSRKCKKVGKAFYFIHNITFGKQMRMRDWGLTNCRGLRREETNKATVTFNSLFAMETINLSVPTDNDQKKYLDEFHLFYCVVQ